MDFKAYAAQTRADMPPLLASGDVFKSITGYTVKTIDYQGKPTEVATIITSEGVRSTFSGVIIKTLKEYFEKNKEPLTNVKVDAPRGKKYLALVGA